MRILFIGAMHTEVNSFINEYKCKFYSKIANLYPIYSARYKNHSIYLLQTFVGNTSSAIGTSLAISKINPDIVIKIGCVGGTSKGITYNDIIVPLGYFHSGAWITRSYINNKPTPDSSKWQTVFGKEPYQVNKKNLGGLPYYFYPNIKLIRIYKELLKNLKIKYTEAFIGGGNIWYFDNKLMDHVRKYILPIKNKKWCADMESYSIAYVCYIYKKPFIGFYFVASSDYEDKEGYNPENVDKQTKETILPLTKKFIDKL